MSKEVPRSPVRSELEHRVRDWIESDPEAATRELLQELLETDLEQLTELFTGRIAFGTAGLRAAMGPGPNRMNRLVVRQTTAGLMSWLPAGALVVVGYDARHCSAQFAADTAGVVAASGGRAELLPGPLPTPVLAAAVLERRADAGVMITASHNPAQDNGYKLYLADGIQLVSPADLEIAAAIDAVAAAGGAVPTAAPDDPAITVLDEGIVRHHIGLSIKALSGGPRQVRSVYTAMHGVGGLHLLAAFEEAGLEPPILVEQQFEPDPDFPTVPFPNPEEPGALDLALALASERAVDVVLANDPDADRLAVAVPGRVRGSGFEALSGDQLGVLLADHLLRRSEGHDRQVASSLVSSRLLPRMAQAAGIRATVTLTGFKWVARPIIEHPELRYLLGYEEAIGYCVGGRVRDKDGISAALVAAEMVADAKASDETLWDRLDRLAVEHGLHDTAPMNVRLPGADGMARRSRLLDELLQSPPQSIAGATLRQRTDLSAGGPLPPTPGLVLDYDDDTRVIVRPSGTEPKLKAYLEVIIPVDNAASLPAARAAASARLEAYRAALTSRFSG